MKDEKLLNLFKQDIAAHTEKLLAALPALMGQDAALKAASLQHIKQSLQALRSCALIVQAQGVLSIVDKMEALTASKAGLAEPQIVALREGATQIQKAAQDVAGAPTAPRAQVHASTDSMADLFLQEAEVHLATLSKGILHLEEGADSATLQSCMRAAHSLKGSATIFHLDAMAHIAHVMEDAFVAVQKGSIQLKARDIDILLAATDHMLALSRQMVAQQPSDAALSQTVLASVQRVGKSQNTAVPVVAPAETGGYVDTLVRLSVESVNQLMDLSGQSLVRSRWLEPFSIHLDSLRERQIRLLQTLERGGTGKSIYSELEVLTQDLGKSITDLGDFVSEYTVLSERLHHEAVLSRMRPFSDAVDGFKRMVRDLSQQLGKQVRLEIRGSAVKVDRDILEQLKAPLTHMVRNSIDHGIEIPERRQECGKQPTGLVEIEARHQGGMLFITVRDDGRGIDVEVLKAKIVEKQLAPKDFVDRMEESEILRFLFLRGFSTAKEVTLISGRGVGLDVVYNFTEQVGGLVNIATKPDLGTTIELQLPLTLSILRSLIVSAGSEPYALPLSRMERTLCVRKDDLVQKQGRLHLDYAGQDLALVYLHEILELSSAATDTTWLSIIVLKQAGVSFGVIVDRFLGEQDLVVQALDARLGKIPNVSSGAILESGDPVLLIDVKDLLRGAEKLISAKTAIRPILQGRKTVLVVDDSVTVRQLLKRVLEKQGYVVELAVDGAEGWNAVRLTHFDLVITDIDMPRLNGLELTALIKAEEKLRNIPVVIVSYKDREEDKARGLEAGASAYLTKAQMETDAFFEVLEKLLV